MKLSKLDKRFNKAIKNVSNDGLKIAMAAVYDASLSNKVISSTMLIELIERIDGVK